MPDINYFEIIQNKLDALVEKIVQKENSDEDFRITYAQILEKINTKMDVFSNDDASERINILANELGALIRDRQEVIESKFNAVKGEFDNLNYVLENSIKSTDLVAAFNKIQTQLSQFTNEQQNQNVTISALISKIEKSGTLEEINELISSQAIILKEQNTVINDGVEKQISAIEQLNNVITDNNSKAFANLNEICSSLNTLNNSLKQELSATEEKIQTKVSADIASIVSSIEETETAVSSLNSNLVTLIEVVGNTFEDEDYQQTKDDVANIFARTTAISEAIKNIATKDEILQNSKDNKEELKKYNEQLISALEQKLLQTLDFSALEDIKGYTEKMFFQGTEVLKEEMWTIKDLFNEFRKHTLAQDYFDAKVIEYSELAATSKDEIIDVISEESVATAKQIGELFENIEKVKSDLSSDINQTKSDVIEVVNEGNIASNNKFATLTSDLHEIKADVELSIQKVKTEVLDALAQEQSGDLAKLSSLSTEVESVKSELTDIISEESVATASQLSEISSTINDLKNAISDIILNEQNEQITSALQNLQSKFVTQLVQIADNITFAEDAEHLQDDIFNSAEELKDKISADIAEIKNDINVLHGSNDIHNENILDLLTKIEKSVQSDVSNDLKTLISGFKLLTSGMLDDKDHIYTMPDIETDLAKIRVELNKIQKSIVSVDAKDGNDITTKLNNIKSSIEKLQETNVDKDITEIKSTFNSINEDISSISKRTNKLILSSDEVNKALKNNISSFSVLIGSFERQSREFYNSAFMVDLNDRIENLCKMTISLVQSDHALNEAFMYIGEWIDSTSDSFDELRADVSKIKRAIANDDDMSQQGIESVVNELSQKIEHQDSKIDAINDKLNTIAHQMQDSRDIKSLLEHVTSQIGVINEKICENDKLTQKITSMEKQLKKIEKNVFAIVDYLDEDSDEYFEEN